MQFQFRGVNSILMWNEEVSMDFYKRVACVCKRIPYGNVATYGQIALLCGSPRNSRQVGYALNRGLAGAEARLTEWSIIRDS